MRIYRLKSALSIIKQTYTGCYRCVTRDRSEQPMKREIKREQQSINRSKPILVFNLPQESDSQSDYVPALNQINEIQHFNYDHTYYNRLRSRQIQNRQDFGFREIIINYPKIDGKMQRLRQQKTYKKMKAQIETCKRVKLQQNIPQTYHKIQYFHTRKYNKGTKQHKIESNTHNKRQKHKEYVSVKKQYSHRLYKQVEQIVQKPKRYRRVKRQIQKVLQDDDIYQQGLSGKQMQQIKVHQMSKQVKYDIESVQISPLSQKQDACDGQISDYGNSSRQLTQSQQEQQR